MNTASGFGAVRSLAKKVEDFNSSDLGKGMAALKEIQSHIEQRLRIAADARRGSASTQGVLPFLLLQNDAIGADRSALVRSDDSTAGSDQYAALDDYTIQSDATDLQQWSDFAAADQSVSLERPIAAMQILAGKSNPTTEQTDAALRFVQDNPSLKTALQGTGALRADGSINKDLLNAFIKQAEDNLALADKNIKDYQKKHPNATRASLNAVRSAALLQAYEPVAGQSAGHKSNGKDNSYTGGKNGGGITTRQQIDDLKNNEGFSSALKAAAEAYATKGAFDAIDRSGEDKATTKANDDLTADNFSHFITEDAPSTQASDQAFLLKASLKNITADTDTSNLNQDIFANPQNYSPQQKAAVMVKLMETLVNVQAGGSDGLRNVDATVAALQNDIQILAGDPATAAHLQQTVPSAMQSLDGMFAQAGGLSRSGDAADDDGGNGGVGTTGNQSRMSGKDIADQVHDGLKDLKSVMDKLRDLAKSNIGGNAAVEAEGAVEGAAESLAEGAIESLAEGVAEEAAVGGAEAAAVGGAEAAAVGGAEAAAIGGAEAAAIGGAEAAAIGGAEAAAIGGAEAAVVGAEAAVVGAEVAGGVVAGGVIAAAAPVLAVAAPIIAVGAAVAGVVGIVFAIVQAIQKAHHQQEFAANVNPTLQQFGIPLPK